MSGELSVSEQNAATQGHHGSIFLSDLGAQYSQHQTNYIADAKDLRDAQTKFQERRDTLNALTSAYHKNENAEVIPGIEAQIEDLGAQVETLSARVNNRQQLVTLYTEMKSSTRD